MSPLKLQVTETIFGLNLRFHYGHCHSKITHVFTASHSFPPKTITNFMLINNTILTLPLKKSINLYSFDCKTQIYILNTELK